LGGNGHSITLPWSAATPSERDGRRGMRPKNSHDE
jgi:hypothetical protein